jgi:hypothetical protein
MRASMCVLLVTLGSRTVVASALWRNGCSGDAFSSYAIGTLLIAASAPTPQVGHAASLVTVFCIEFMNRLTRCSLAATSRAWSTT